MVALYLIFFATLLLPAFAFALLPLLPSVPYMLVVAVVYDLISGRINQNEMIVLVAIAAVSILIDYLSGLLGARWGGASGKSLIVGTVGMIIGSLILPLFGGLIGLFLGVLIAETLLFAQSRKAIRAASASLIGSIVGMVVNILLCLLFFVLFLVFSIKV